MISKFGVRLRMELLCDWNIIQSYRPLCKATLPEFDNKFLILSEMR